MKKLLVSLSIFTFLWACNSEKVNEQTPAKKNILVQVSVIDALLQGIYDGIMPIGELLEYG
ncbi:MAG TPA: hypothetical protein PKV50_00985, partial [Prolixibacteraceae bacterium]|nr:hypothetical protein [Prolixibacteraceae bacterium]